MQSLNASGGHATRWDAAAHRTSRRPSPLCTVLEKCTHQPQCCGVAWRRAADGLPRQAGSSAAAQQLKFSRKQQSARQGESAACRPTWLPKGRGTVAGLLGSHLIGAACPRAPRGAPCPCREGCSDRGTLGSRLKEPEGASAAPKPGFSRQAPLCRRRFISQENPLRQLLDLVATWIELELNMLARLPCTILPDFRPAAPQKAANEG